MYMAHLGLALGARRLSRSLPLWVLLVASILPDVADTVGGFTPWASWVSEHSHTLLGMGSLALLMGLLGWFIARSGFAALLAATLVISHLPMDCLTGYIHAWPGGPAIGLHLYRHRVADFMIEFLLILIGVYFYRQSLKEAQRRPGILIAILGCLGGFQLLGDLIVAG